MKIRKDKIDMFESIRRINEEISRLVLRDELSVFTSRRFQDADRRRADRHNSLRVVDLGRSFSGNGKRFRMHPMFGDIFGVQCKPAVGAASAPGFCAKTV